MKVENATDCPVGTTIVDVPNPSDWASELHTSGGGDVAMLFQLL